MKRVPSISGRFVNLEDFGFWTKTRIGYLAQVAVSGWQPRMRRDSKDNYVNPDTVPEFSQGRADLAH